MVEELHWTWPIREVGAQAARFHSFEPKCHRAFDFAVFYGIVCLIKCRGAGRAVIVDIDDGDMSEAKVIEGALRKE